MVEETNNFLLKVYSLLSEDEEMENIPNFDLENIDQDVEAEMHRIKKNCLRKEEQYVEEMLLTNPIVIERPNNAFEEDNLNDANIPNSSKESINTFLNQQRDSAYLHLRYSNKIKKAKLKYRHQHMTNKLLKSFKLFNCVYDRIQEAQQHLYTKGFTFDQIKHLRDQYGLDKALECCNESEDSSENIQN